MGTGGPAMLAHSARPRDGEPDGYERHVAAVRDGAVARAEAMLRYRHPPVPGMLESIRAAALFHDLGKLDPDNQAALHVGRRGKLMWDHIDAGVAHLSAQHNCMAAWLVRAHHPPGLPRRANHFPHDRRLRGRRRDDEAEASHSVQIARTDGCLEQYLAQHHQVLPPSAVVRRGASHGLTMRLALSCLVDADHSDTALFERGPNEAAPAEPRWAERLEALTEYVRHLPSGDTETERERNRRRQEFFEACIDAPDEGPIMACEGPVGIGKTTAVTAYLLRRARDRGLRRLFIVAPFTNILTQTADRLRKALVLPGEAADSVIVEHHHRADFAEPADRALAVLWRTPIILTTAVSFFETLAASEPGRLRKLHALPGSVVFVDEAHAALPPHLLRLQWIWLRELARKWSCELVLASGSLAKWWEHEEVVEPAGKLPELMPEAQVSAVLEAERARVRYAQVDSGKVVTVSRLVELVKVSPGPRLVILNTVQNAAVVAQAVRLAGLEVLHLSTALAPRDRERILRLVTKVLRSRRAADWTLVATSCVEAGVDLSFRTAFRERFSVASTLQVAGRVNRHGEYSQRGGGVVYDFALADQLITEHPGARISADVLCECLLRDELNTKAPAEIVTAAMCREIRMRATRAGDAALEAELAYNYPEVQERCRVIQADTRFVVVDSGLRERLESGELVGWRDLLEGSVQMWARRINQLALMPVAGYTDVYAWTGRYDPRFLGYMSEVLANVHPENKTDDGYIY